MIKSTLIECQPFIRLLTEVRDVGRAQRDNPSEINPGEELINLARKAHAVLKWLEADQEGKYEIAESWLGKAK